MAKDKAAAASGSGGEHRGSLFKKKGNHFSLFKKLFGKDQDAVDIDVRKFQLELVHVITKASESPFSQEWFPDGLDGDRWEAVLSSNRSLARQFKNVLKSDPAWAQRLASLIEVDESSGESESEGDESQEDSNDEEEGEVVEAEEHEHETGHGERKEHHTSHLNEQEKDSTIDGDDREQEERQEEEDSGQEIEILGAKHAAVGPASSTTRKRDHPPGYLLEGVAIRFDSEVKRLEAVNYIVDMINTHPEVQEQSALISSSDLGDLFPGKHTWSVVGSLYEILESRGIRPPHKEAIRAIWDSLFDDKLMRLAQQQPETTKRTASEQTTGAMRRESSGSSTRKGPGKEESTIFDFQLSPPRKGETESKAKKRKLDASRVKSSLTRDY